MYTCDTYNLTTAVLTTHYVHQVGVTDAVVQLLSAARDVAARSPYQRAIVPKLIELADEIMRFGDTNLQEGFLLEP